MRENERVEIVERPGREIYREHYIQPIVQKEKVDLVINRGDNREVKLEDLHMAPEINNVLR